jgi:chorismate mutase
MTPEIPSPDPLETVRGRLDQYDELIVALIAHRTAATRLIGAEKRRRGLPTMNPLRHSQVVRNYMDAVPEGTGMTRVHAAEVSELVQRISREAQDADRVTDPAPAPRVDDLGAVLVDMDGLAAEAAAALAETDGRPAFRLGQQNATEA